MDPFQDTMHRPVCKACLGLSLWKPLYKCKTQLRGLVVLNSLKFTITSPSVIPRVGSILSHSTWSTPSAQLQPSPNLQKLSTLKKHIVFSFPKTFYLSTSICLSGLSSSHHPDLSYPAYSKKQREPKALCLESKQSLQEQTPLGQQQLSSI